MKHLSRLRPAETLLILEDKKADLRELLKITFMDLLFKEVLEIKIIEKQSSRGDRVRYYRYVVKGKNFESYRPLYHEMVYLSPFYKSSSLQILLQHLVRMGFENAKSESALHAAIYQSPNISQYFYRNFYNQIFGGFSISQEGLELRTTIYNEIGRLEKELPEYISSDNEKTQEILDRICGNIFLLKNINIELFKEIDSIILSEMSKKSREGGGSGGGCFGCSSWDNGCSSSGNSGCSGSGCGGSGCSGCGGCGGGCS